MSFLETSYVYIQRKDILKTLVIFQLLTNLLQTNLNKNCKAVYVIRIVLMNNKITQKKDKNAMKQYKTNSLYTQTKTIILTI